MNKLSKWDYVVYNRKGEPCTMREWSEEFSSPHVFRKEKVVNGYRVLTKWTGIDMPEYSWLNDHDFSMKTWKPGKPKPFVSYVWTEDNILVSSRRYATIEQAYEGHANIVDKVSRKSFGMFYNPTAELAQLEEQNA